MAFSKARRLSDFIAADGTIPTGKFASGTITSDHIADTGVTHADLHTNMDLTGKTVLVANASTGDNDTTAANTAFVQQEIAALVDSSPSALNTLNELAAALGDDANFSTTVNNNIAAKLPLSGGTMTGALNMGSQAITNLNTLASTHFSSSANINSSGDGGLFIPNGKRLGFDQSGTRSWTQYAAGGNLLFASGDGNGAIQANNFTGVTLTLSGAISSGAITSSGNLQATSLTAGTANPNAELLYLLGSGHTGHGASNTVSLASIAESTSGNTMGLWIGSMTNQNTAVIGTRTSSGNLAIQTYNGGWAERVRIDYTGKVGIGETNPDFMLHVKNTNTQIAIESTTTNQNSSLYYIANGANQWETGVNISAGLDYEIYDRVNNGSRLVVHHDGKIRIGNNVPMWSGSYGGGLFLKGNNATSDRYARLAIVDSTGAETSSGSLTLNNNGSVEITRSINGSGSTSYENILKISRSGGATSNAQREAAISFHDSANSTYTAMITGVRTSPAGNYDGGLSIYTNSHSQNGNATSISEMVSGHVVHFSASQATTFYGDVYVSGANHRISQNGVTREAKGGYVNGNATVSYTVNHTNQSSFKVQAAMSHYGIMTSYGCAHEGIYGNGSGGLYSVLTQSHTSGASGSWSVNRVDTDNITVTKNAGTYAGGGYYYIIVEGANL